MHRCIHRYLRNAHGGGLHEIEVQLGFRARNQFDPEHAARPYSAFHSHDAIHELDEALAHHQADARAFLSTAFLPEPVEGLEELSELLRAQSSTGVADAYVHTRRGDGDAIDDDGAARAVVLDGIGQQVDEHLFQARMVRHDKDRMLEMREGHFDPALLRQGPDHGLAFKQHRCQGDGFEREQQPPGFNHREVEDFIDQLEQVPACMKDLVNAAPLRGGRRRLIGLHELSKAKNGVERRAQFMAHAGKEIGLCEAGLFRRCRGLFQLGSVLLQHLVPAFALSHIARGGEHAQQFAIAIVEVGGVVGHDGLPAVLGQGGQLVIGDLALDEHQLDGLAGPVRIGKVVLEGGAYEFFTRASGQGLHLLVHVGDDAGGIGRHQRVDVGFDQRPGIKLLISQALVEKLALVLGLLARGVVRADEQVADDGVLIVAQGGDGHHRREAAAILADVGELVDVLDAA